MNIFQKALARLDDFQRTHPVISFPLAVAKKYGDDHGGYQAALLTYYGFLSLFPLLLVLTTVLHLAFFNNSSLQSQVGQSISTFFPLLGDELQSNISSMGKTGLSLAAGILVTLYGARGVADALRFALNNMWQVPMSKRPGFPKNIAQSFNLVGLGTLGLIASVAVSGLTSALGNAWWVDAGLNILGFIIGALLLAFIFRSAVAREVGLKDVWVGAALGAFIIQLLLAFGSLIVSSQLKNLDSFYGTFAIVLGLLFWIYLITQVIVYAAEVNTVRMLKLWPRALMSENPTEADKRALELYAKTEKRLPPQHIRSRLS